MHFILTLIIGVWLMPLSLTIKSKSVHHSKFLDRSLNFNASEDQKFNILAALFTSGGSHFQFFKPLLEELARRGHNLTVLSHNPRKKDVAALPNYRDIVLEDPGFVARNVINPELLAASSYSPAVQDIINLREFGITYCKMTLNNSEVRHLINSDQKFDLIFMEVFCGDCALGFVHKFQAPVIALSSHEIMPWINDRLGNPDNPSYIPQLFELYSSQMNFMQRVINTFNLCWLKTSYEILFQWSHQKIVDDAFGPGVPPLSEIAKKTSALFVNTHFSIHGSRPYVPNVIEVGGLHLSKPKPLPDDIQKFLDDANEGALIFSWGSMVNMSSVSPKKIDDILRVFEEMPQKVIWKWEADQLPRKLKNVMVKKWLPQFDVMSEYCFDYKVDIFDKCLKCSDNFLTLFS